MIKGRVIRYVSVGYIWDLIIGSLWLNQECIRLPESIYDKIICEVDYQYSNYSLFHPFECDSDNQSIIPHSNYTIGHRKVSKCVGIRNKRFGTDPYGLILPISEIIRFYYCHTSELAQAFFGGCLNYPDKIRNIYNPNETNIFEIPPRIRLGKNMPYGQNSGPIVARLLASILASDTGLRHAKGIFRGP